MAAERIEKKWFNQIQHFQWLKSYLAQRDPRSDALNIWSLDCDTGEEIYSLLFLLLKEKLSPKEFKILGTDKDSAKVQAAFALRNSPEFELQKSFLLKSAPQLEEFIETSVTKSVKFRNEIAISEIKKLGIKFDIVFLHDNSKTSIEHARANLKSNGYLILDPHLFSKFEDSEFKNIQSTIFQYNPKVKTQVLIVEDSKPIQKILEKIYSGMSHVEVVGIESTVKGAFDKYNDLKPDLISLDMNLEDGTGVDLLNKIKFVNQVGDNKSKCVLVTDCSINEGNLVFDALSLGASSYVQKPKASDLESFANDLNELLTEFTRSQSSPHLLPIEEKSDENISINLSKKRLIAIGSSTGGTEVVRDLIGGLPKNSPPILVVQHMPGQFTKLFSERIQRQTGRPTYEVSDLTELKQGCAYLAAGGRHVTVEKRGSNLYARPTDTEPVNRFKPSISVLFQSIFNVGLSESAVAIILTGMGRDGSEELLKLKNAGSLTIGQSQKSCVVYGMPRAAAEIGALCWSGSPTEIVRKLSKAKS